MPSGSQSISVLIRPFRVLAGLLALALSLPGASAAQTMGQPYERIAAVLETRVPAQTSFLLRGTVPVPRGLYPQRDGRNPFTILDYDGSPTVTQIEVVSRYPREEDGADVVELLARVRRDPAAVTNAPAQYSVALWHQSPPPHGGLDAYPDAVRNLIEDPDAIEIATYDCFGNRYVARPFAQDHFTVLHRGPVQTEVRLYENLVPEQPVPGGTLPHLMGVHTYMSFFRNSLAVELDLRFHNAHDGRDPADPQDDALDKIYFQRLELSIPEDWVLQQDFPDPLFGAEHIANGRRIVQIVGPNPGGGLHVMRWQAQFHRRLIMTLDREGPLAAARSQLDGAGRAFAVRGFDEIGREYFSWWNSETARYYPQRALLPLLDHIGRNALDAEIAGDLSQVAGHLRNGTGTGNYPVSAGQLGWGHPYGVSYGGMTSGLEINCFDGMETAAAASPAGLQFFLALHRMATDRQPNALYQGNGDPSSVEEWLTRGNGIDYVPFEHFVVPLVSGSRPDPFGVRSAPRFQVDYVVANGLQPPYEAAHLGFDPHDYQHFVRYTRAAKVLAWLANDSLAKDDLCMQAENFNLSFHQYPNNSTGGAQSSGFLSMKRGVEAHPGKGCPYGRGEAWGLDTVSATYSCGSKEWRAGKRPWLRAQMDMLLQAQGTCNGFIQAQVSSKAVDGKYRARQLIEQSLTENALAGVHESVFREADPTYAQLVRDVLTRSLRAFISEMAWFPGQTGPWRYTGVGPIDINLPVWCSRGEMPADAVTIGDIETYQDWCSFAYGYELTRDGDFIRFARTQSGAADLADLGARLKAAGTNNLENRAALLALVQRLLGEL